MLLPEGMLGKQGEAGTCFGMRGCVYVGVYTEKCKGKELEHLGCEGMTGEQGRALLPQTPLIKGYLNSGLPDRALGTTSPILLHDKVEVGVVPLSLGDVPLSLHRPLVSMDGMSVSRQGTDMIMAGRAVPTAGSDVNLGELSQSSPGALVFFAGSFCTPVCSLGHLVHFLGILLCASRNFYLCWWSLGVPRQVGHHLWSLDFLHCIDSGRSR